MMMAFLSNMQICLFKKLHGELSAWCAHHVSFDCREQQCCKVQSSQQQLLLSTMQCSTVLVHVRFLLLSWIISQCLVSTSSWLLVSIICSYMAFACFESVSDM